MADRMAGGANPLLHWDAGDGARLECGKTARDSRADEE